MDKLLTIVCAAPNGAVRNKPWMAPGAIPELKAMVPEGRGYQVVGWDENAKGPIAPGLLETASLVMLTGLTPSYYRMNEIAKGCKEAGKSLIAGGRDPIGWSREEGGLGLLAERFPSFCTTGMSLDLMAEILSDNERGELRQHYALPAGSPYEFVLPDRSVITPSDYIARYCLRSSSGCNRRCGWCTVGGSGLHLKPPEMLEKELTGIKDRFFLDVADSFAADREFIEQAVLPIYKRSHLWWGTEVTVADLLGQDGEGKLITEMKKAGGVLVYIGIESVTRGSVRGKSDCDKAEEVIRRCRREGIVVIGSLILDAYGDETVEEIEETIDWAKKNLDFAQFSNVAALPGCEIRRNALAQGTIIETNWRNFDGAHPTLEHALSREERARLHAKAYADFSNLPGILRRAARARGVLKLPVLCCGLRYRHGVPGL